MSRQIFINLATKDVNAAKMFFDGLGGLCDCFRPCSNALK